MAEIKITTDDVSADTIGFDPVECEICREELNIHRHGRSHSLTDCLRNLRKRIEKLEPKAVSE